MGEVPQWSTTHLNGDTDQQGALHGIVVRNTFIDVCHPQDVEDDEGVPTSPGHRRNSSAPPSPGRRSKGADEWGKDPLPDEELDEEELGGIPNYQWRLSDNNFFYQECSSAQEDRLNALGQVLGDCFETDNAEADQYIEDEPPAHKFWHEPPQLGSSGSSPPGLLLSSPTDPREGKGARKVRPAHLTLSTKGHKGPPSTPLDTHLRSGELGFDSWHGGPEHSFAPGSGMAFSYANGFGVGGHERSGLGPDNVPVIGGPEQRGREGASGFPLGHAGQPDLGQAAVGYPFGPGHPVQPGFIPGVMPVHVGGHRLGRGFGVNSQIGPPGVHPAFGGLGSFGQDIWNMDASARWVDPSVHQGQSPTVVPPPPIEPPPSRDASQRLPQHGAPQQHGAPEGSFPGGPLIRSRKERRGHLIQQSAAGEGSAKLRSPGFAGGAYGQAPGGAGLGIAAGAAAVSPLVSGHPVKGPSAGRGRDPLVVGPPAGAPSFGGQEAGSAPSAGGPPAAEMGISQRRMVNAGKGGQGPWIPEGIDISAALAMAAPRQERGGKKREEAKGAGGSNNADGPGIPTNAAGSRMPLSGGGPKRTDYVRKYGPAVDDEGNNAVPIVTMMLKNIPCRKSQEEVMSHIDGKGFSHKYDFFYLPRDVKFRANLGYAFINFVTPEDAAAFQAEMNGYRFANSGSSKACAVVPAHVQGLMNNLAAFKRTEVMRSSRKPYFSGVVVL